MAQTASLQELLAASQDYGMSNIYTSIPGVVVSVANLSEMRVDVQPSINVRSPDGLQSAPRPPILSVPLQMPLTREGGLSYPISVGTPVLLTFSMRGLDVWKMSSGLPEAPSDLRKFDIRDCFCIPGIYPFSESPNNPSKRSNNHDPSDVVLVHNIGGNEVEIRLKRDGRAFVKSPVQVVVESPEVLMTGNLTVNGTMSIEGEGGSGLTTIKGNFDIVGNVLQHNGKNIGSTHTHGGVQSGGSNTNVPN